MKQLQHPTSGRVFDNPVLERLSRTSPALIIAFYSLLAAAALFANFRYRLIPHPGAAALLFAGGVLAWTLFEYLLHRYLFHFVNENPFVQRFHFLAHGFHHEHPRDADHLFMPPPVGLMFVALFAGMFYLLLRQGTVVFMAGFILGYLMYSLVHYSIHRHRPPARMKTLWRHHHLHHYRFPDKAYGVSTTLWDRVFGTMPPVSRKQEVASSKY